MKGLILFESFYGNTREVAQAIAAPLIAAGHQVTLVDVREAPKPTLDCDFLIIGSPTRFGKATRRIRKTAKRIDASYWKNKYIGVFDTYMPVVLGQDERKTRRWIEPGAAGRLKELLESKGLKLAAEPLRCRVNGIKGPLADGELDRAAAYASELLNILRQST